MPNIVVNKLIENVSQQVLGREDISGKIAGTVTLGDAIVANLSELNVGAKSELFRLAADGPVNMTLANSGGVAGKKCKRKAKKGKPGAKKKKRCKRRKKRK